MKRVRYAISDLLVITRRNVLRIYRTPSLLIFSSIQPVMFLLLFNYVFGGSVSNADTGQYINYLLPGILAQTALFGSMQTGVGTAEDISKGAIDRFRSLPMANSAVLGGRTLADGARNIFTVALMFGVGLLLGFRYNDGLFNCLLGLSLMVLFGYAFSWISACVGLLIKESEAVQTASFLFIFPLTFASAVFVPISGMPSWLQVFARNQPVTQVVTAVRALMGGGSLTSIWITLAWIIGIIAVFAPISIYLYRKAT